MLYFLLSEIRNLLRHLQEVIIQCLPQVHGFCIRYMWQKENAHFDFTGMLFARSTSTSNTGWFTKESQVPVLSCFSCRWASKIGQAISSALGINIILASLKVVMK